jgi:cyclohexanecarboxylate-CoA ligase
MSTFWAFLRDAAAQQPDTLVATDDYGRSLTRRDLVERAEPVAAGLAAAGVGVGTTVSWQLPTTMEAFVVMAALARLGAVQNPIIPALREREVRFITAQVDTEVLVVPTAWRGFDHAAMARSIAADRPMHVLEVDLDDLGDDRSSRLPVASADGLAPAPRDDGAGATVRWIYYSSGTTAQPKGIRHTDASILASTGALLGGVAFGPDDVYPIAWPLSHIGGASMLGVSLIGGVRLVLFDTFDPAVTPARMAAHRPTLVGTAVPFFRAFLDAQERQPDVPLFPALRAGAFGGAPVPAEVHVQMRRVFDVALVGSWGLTEFPNATSAAPDDPFELLLGTVGRPGPGVEVRVAATDGGVCPVPESGESDEGELQLRGPQRFAGYVDSALDADASTDDGWFRTGDLGRIDFDGNVRITGRMKDIVIRNAENISVLEVEELLFRHPAVSAAAVLGLPDPRTGERVCAAVVLRDGETLSLDELRTFCRTEGLALHKCPEQLEIMSELPHNAMGKVAKPELRARLAPAS